MHIQPIDNATDLEPYVTAAIMNSEQQQGAGAGETFDDVWGSEPSSPTQQEHHQQQQQTEPVSLTERSGGAHPSDIPRLRAEHTTSGYREGVTAAKNASIQAGFDEGFGLGAAIGAQAGQILGILEGIANALATTSSAEEAREEAATFLRDARAELSIERVFGAEYWNADGTWKYDVPGEDGAQGEEEEAAATVLFAHVAAAHPLVARWAGVVEGQVARWGVDRGVFADVADEERQHAQEKPVGSGGGAAQQTRKPLDW